MLGPQIHCSLSPGLSRIRPTIGRLSESFDQSLMTRFRMLRVLQEALEV